MIFGKQLLPLVLSGSKTMTRRRVDPSKPCRYIVGRTYAVVPGRTKPRIPGVRLRILAVRRERLGDLTEADAVHEGFADVAEFRAYWQKLYRKAPDLRLLVWAITFELVHVDGE